MCVRRRVVFLISRLSDYMLNCLDAWSRQSRIDILVVRKSVDAVEAPFDFNRNSEHIRFVDFETIQPEALLPTVAEFAPNLIVCFGWANSIYLNLVRQRPPDIPAVITMDTQWLGTMRQRLGLIWGRSVLPGLFDAIWVPGAPQRRFAGMLGFSEHRIYEGLYVANRDRFNTRTSESLSVPARRFYFVGRYVELKGLRELWRAFIEFDQERTAVHAGSDWSLVCIGTGPLFEHRADHPAIKHLGFVQPEKIGSLITQGGVFILPSHYEPWGLVVHEFAIAGFPLLVSDAVGAASTFVRPENGYVFKSKDVPAIKACLHRVADLTDEERANMGRASMRLGGSPSVADWCATANRFFQLGAPKESARPKLEVGSSPDP